MMSTNSRWRSVMFSGERSSSSTNPLIEVSGLRSSCDAVATNSDLARSSRARSVMSRTVQTTPSESLPSCRGGDRRACVRRARRPSPRASASSSGGSGLPGASIASAGDELGHELGRARVDGGDRDRVGLGHDQRVAEALDRDREPLALVLDPLLGARPGPRPSR